MLIGSRAIAYWNPEFKIRSNSDWDIIGTPESESWYRKQLKIPDEDRIEWHSPYQDERFSFAAQEAGFAVDIIETDQGKVHFFGEDDSSMTAWEVAKNVDTSGLATQNRAVYQQAEPVTHRR